MNPVIKLACVLSTMQFGVIPAVPSVVEGEVAGETADSLSAAVDRLELSSGPRPEDPGEEQDVVIVEEEAEELEALPETPYPHIFVFGDSADAFGAIKAGYTAYWQAGVAASNLIRLASVAEQAEQGLARNRMSSPLSSYSNTR